MESTTVYLTDDELVRLDGLCRPEIQSKVDIAKQRIKDCESMSGVSREIAEFVSDVIQSAQKRGRLVCRGCQVRQCRICKKSLGYAKYTRNSRHHRKGESDFSKPLYLYGIDLEDSFITFTGSPGIGCCNECWKDAKPVLIEKLNGVQAEISEHITGHPPKYKKYKNMKCGNCGWEGHEGQMSLKPALMGGSYHGGCPECKAENNLFSSTIKTIDGFQVVETNG